MIISSGLWVPDRPVEPEVPPPPKTDASREPIPFQCDCGADLVAQPGEENACRLYFYADCECGKQWRPSRKQGYILLRDTDDTVYWPSSVWPPSQYDAGLRMSLFGVNHRGQE